MKNILIALVLISFVTLPLVGLAASKKLGWYTAGSIENSGNSGFGGLRYQKTIDEETRTVCYTAISQNRDVAISCVK